MFIFGGDTGVDYQQLQKRRAIADAMMQRSVSGTPKNVGEGLTAIGNAIFGKIADKRLQKKEASAREDANRLMAALLGGGSTYGNPYAGGYAPPTPAQKAAEAFPTGGTPAPDIMSDPVTARSPQDVMAQYDVAENNADPGLGYEQRGQSMDPLTAAIMSIDGQGADANYYKRLAEIESSYGKNLANPNSSARGPFQFIQSTAKQFGINPSDMDFSDDARGVAQFTEQNRQALARTLGREPTPGELYLAHQQGAGGAIKLLSNPNARAVDVVGAEAVRLNGGNPNMSAGEFANLWASKFGDGPKGMGYNPSVSPQMGGMAGGQRVAGGNIEQIVQLLSNPYASPAQQMIAQTLLQQSMTPEDPMKALQMQKLQAELAQMGQPQPGKLVELYDEQTGQPYKAEFNPQTGQYERVGGVKAPSGMTFESDGQGGFRLTQGGVSGKPLTEGEGKNTGFLIRGRESNAILNDLEAEGTSLGGKIKSGLPLVGNYLQTPEYRRYDQARRDFINAVLRRESGAVISPEEFANAELQYFPQPGDDPETIAQKRRNREDAVKGFEVGAGAGAKNPLVPQGPSPTPTTGARLRFNPETGELE